MEVLAIGDLTIGHSLLRCSVAILRMRVVLKIWVRLPIGLALVGRLVWWRIVGLTRLGGDGGLPGGRFNGRGHV